MSVTLAYIKIPSPGIVSGAYKRSVLLYGGCDWKYLSLYPDGYTGPSLQVNPLYRI